MMATAVRRASTAALPPLVVVIGTTGAGKTKLSIDVADALGGEIVNADAMQLYSGLDVATAKATAEEMRGVPHHLLSCLPPEHAGFTVQEYTRRAVRAIDDIHARGKIPILVGGTMYYVQAVLWDSLLAPIEGSPAGARSSDGGDGGGSSGIVAAIGATSASADTGGSGGGSSGSGSAAAAAAAATETAAVSAADVALLAPEHLSVLGAGELHRLLARLDPARAATLHANNVRKVRSSLDVLRTSGTRHSELMAEQQRRQRAAGPRFNAVALWVRSDAATLDARLDRRVDAMVRDGVVDEVRRLWRLLAAAAQRDGSTEHKGGVVQSIGYKEFTPLLELEALDEALDAPPLEGGAAQRAQTLAACVDRLKATTRRYARKQLRWIRNRFVGRDVPTVPVDSSDVARWAEVTGPVIDGVRRWLNAEDALPLGTILPGSCGRRVCPECNGRVLLGDEEWSEHIASQAHLKALRRARKRARPSSQRGAKKPRDAAAESAHAAEPS
jgi:tRNA dimethylallyltransferase